MTHALPLHGVALLTIAASLTLGRSLSASAAEVRAGGASPAPSSDPSAVLGRVRKATGWPLSLAGEDLVVRGRIESPSGRDGFSWRFGEGGRFLRETTGVLGRQVGCDGDSTWLHDAAGRSQVLVFADEENARLLSAVLSGQWLAPGSGVTVTAGPDSSDGLTRVVLGLGRRRSTLAIDPVSGEPRVLALRPSFGGETWTFAEFTKQNGLVYPRRIEQKPAAGGGDHFVIESVSRMPAAPAASYAQPAGGERTHFDAGVVPGLRVERSANGFLLVHPKIDGREVGAFIFDTGAGANVIDPRLADSLGLEKSGTSWLGMAAGAASAGIRRAQSVALGPLTIEHPVFLEMDLGPVSAASGAEIVGIIGYDVLARAVVEIELERSRIAVHDPASFHASDLAWEPITLYGNHAHVKGSFDGHEGWFRLDTGAPQVPVIFNGPTVERWHLLEGREVKKAKVGLPGGEMEVAFGSVEGLEIGGHRFAELSALFPLERGGAFDDEYTLGNLGQECLKPFRAVFDYRQRRIALAARHGVAADDPRH